MFEEGQLYSPVTTGEDGSVTVHLGDDHPGVNDPAYRARRNEIAQVALGWQPGEPVPRIDYTDVENGVWATVSREIAPLHERYACRAFNEAKAALDLPADRVPQLDEVTAGLQRLTGFSYVPAAGIVPLEEFYGSLADGVFHSTQYLRHHDLPLYTPEPDVIHEVLGHGNLLADRQVAEVKRAAGRAARRMETRAGLQMVADVFWFTVEFGVLHEGGDLKAYGAGILSSYGEIEEFGSMVIRPLDFRAMATIDYDITHYQPVLFAAESFSHMVDAVGGFFDECTDDTAAAMGLVEAEGQAEASEAAATIGA
ncbi:phenylalanine 4-monooxygenase [Nocardioides sp. GY 10113]|uniref:phenylalanine 4-monooxygenase n=1 Tax=Nocardioides sp. GY 10113 TaxID=2569761 RepID=UPI0010A76DA5|nr:phenylalanine 4-monooxygenase [Nocardioides sp. GY 10113]TIC79612.1 phenylalanine 4-monooxygenase [Nocardioides sp. GY 10113]TIC79641.1 phenylalanine 4-monooxygenase [Nocardioides sp. GY 10113]